MDRKLLFFDVDGTLITERQELPASVPEAIRTARKNGHICLVNSGRPFSAVPELVKAIGFDGYVCSCGSYIVLNGELLYRDGFTREESLEIAEKLRECHFAPLMEAEECIWFDGNGNLPPVMAEVRRMYLQAGLSVRNFDEDPAFRMDKFCALSYELTDKESFFRYIEPRCMVIDRGRNFYELVKKPNSKEAGMRRVMEHFGTGPDSCFAFGDSSNDITMLRAVTHSVAMGQAPEEIRALAEYVTDSPENDGIEKALRHYGLI